MIDLEQQSPTAAHWTERQYRELFQTLEEEPLERLVLVIEERAGTREAGLLGFLVARHLPPEWEVENLVITPAARRKGYATRLLQALFSRAKEAKSESVFIEVRESNQAARTLYRGQGFEEVGIRSAYYSSPVEDAILYRRSLL